MSVNAKIVGASALGGALLAAAMPGGFRPDAWCFGVFLGFGQSAIGLRCYREALSRRTLSLGRALAGGVVRVFVMLLALAIAIWLGYPAAPLAWAALSMYVAMMVAEIAVVARLTVPVPQEVR